MRNTGRAILVIIILSSFQYIEHPISTVISKNRFNYLDSTEIVITNSDTDEIKLVLGVEKFYNGKWIQLIDDINRLLPFQEVSGYSLYGNHRTVKIKWIPSKCKYLYPKVSRKYLIGTYRFTTRWYLGNKLIKIFKTNSDDFIVN